MNPKLLSATLPSYGWSIVNVWLGGTVLYSLLLGAEITIGSVVFGG